MSHEGGKHRHFTLIVVPDGGQESKSYRISYRRVRFLAGALGLLTLMLAVMAGSWWYLAARVARVGDVTALETQLEQMLADSVRVQDLAEQLAEIERQYEAIRGLFAASAAEVPSEVWLPPASGSVRLASEVRRTLGPTLPDVWPLTQPGFVTRGLIDDELGEHPGIDIAVPTDSYVRASGGGTVVDVGDDDVYGRFVVIQHPDGYSSLYGHASMTLVVLGQQVRQREVIAVSGSTGHSTAPHLHFEILLDGQVVDPLTMVSQP